MNSHRLLRWAVAIVAIVTMSGCVVVPYPYHRARVYYDVDAQHAPRPMPR